MAKAKKAAKELTPEEKLARALVPAEEQPYRVPGNWCWVRFDVLIELISGRDAALSECNDKGLGIPYILGASNINNNTFSVERWIESPQVISRKNDILLSVKGTIGKLYLQQETSINISRQIMAIRPLKGVNAKFTYYFLLCICNELQEAGNGLIPGISRSDILEKAFSLPPLAEQQRIVDRIESLFAKLDEAKEKTQAVVDGFELRRSAILHRAFTGELTEKWRLIHGIELKTWERTEIGSISDVKGGKRVPKGMSLTIENTGHPYIKAGNLKQGTVLDDEIMYIPNDVLQYIKNYTVHTGDVYITNVGACIGDCGIIPEKYDGANLTENAVKITNMKCDNHFLAWYLSSGDVQQKIKTLIASATLGKLSITNIKTIPVLLPTKKEQTEIIKIIESILSKEQQAKEAAESVLIQIDIMKKAILARAFRGELGTNDPDEESAEALLKQIL